jgi:hypothetical protein
MGALVFVLAVCAATAAGAPLLRWRMRRERWAWARRVHRAYMEGVTAAKEAGMSMQQLVRAKVILTRSTGMSMDVLTAQMEQARAASAAAWRALLTEQRRLRRKYPALRPPAPPRG